MKAFPWNRGLFIVTRMVLAAISLILAAALVNVFQLFRYGLGHLPDPKIMLQGFWIGSFQIVLFGAPGLILALPAIIFLTDLRQWRFWALLALGTAIGPIYMWLWLAWGLGWRTPFGVGILKFSAPISALSSLIYLLLLRRAQRFEQA